MSPSGQGLWLFLLTDPQHHLPGLIATCPLQVAGTLQWPTAATERCFQELVERGMLKTDGAARVVLLSNAFRYRPPRNPNVVASWSKSFQLIPECELRDEWLGLLRGHLEERGVLQWLENTGLEIIPGMIRGMIPPMIPGIEVEVEVEVEEERRREVAPTSGALSVFGTNGKPTANQKDLEHAEQIRLWCDELVAAIEAQGGDRRYVEHFLHELSRGISEYYESRKGSFTLRRRGVMAKRLRRYDADSVMYAIEVWCDKHYGKTDENYVCGIAMNAMKLTQKQRDQKRGAHRKREGETSLHVQATDLIREEERR